MLKLVWVFCIILTTILSEEYPKVLLNTGPAKGLKSKTILNQKPYYKFMGLPYAEPPIGNLRFREPVPKKPWSGTFDATKEGNKCVQGKSPFTHKGNEDCLNNNFYTPDLQGNAPILVWIHGGGFKKGSNVYKDSAPDNLIEHNLCFVSINYRLSIFGFSSTGDSANYGNNGIKDVLLSLKWIQTNAKSFGCDASRVILWGQSAGAAIASILGQSPAATGLFHKLILFSGTGACPWSRSSKPRELMFTVGLTTGILAFNNSQTLLRELRKKSTAQIHEAATLTSYKYFLENPLYELFPISPVIEVANEKAVFTDNFFEALEAGNFNKVPIMLGITSLEAAHFIKPPNDSKFCKYKEVVGRNIFNFLGLGYLLVVKRLVPNDMNIKNETIKEILGYQIRDFYFKDENYINNLINFASETTFDRPVIATSRLTSQYVETFTYIFNYSSSNTSANRGDVGHSEELQFVFAGRKDFVKGSIDDHVRNGFTKLIANFVFGHPTPVVDAELDNLNWTLTKPDDVQFMVVNEKFSMMTNLYDVIMAFWDGLYKFAEPPKDRY